MSSSPAGRILTAACVARVGPAAARMAATPCAAFTPVEIEQCSCRPFPEQSLIARLAAKRALRSLVPELPRGCAFGDITVTTSEAGSPGFDFSPSLEERLTALGLVSAHVSLTHLRSHAAAFVVLEVSSLHPWGAARSRAARP